jgi:hypothetical protein
VKILLDAGADATAHDEDDRSPLHLASSLGNAGVGQLLLLRVSTDIINEVHGKFGSALDTAYANPHSSVVKVLLHCGAKESLDLSWTSPLEAPKISQPAGTVSDGSQVFINTVPSIVSSGYMSPCLVSANLLPFPSRQRSRRIPRASLERVLPPRKSQ